MMMMMVMMTTAIILSRDHHQCTPNTINTVFVLTIAVLTPIQVLSTRRVQARGPTHARAER